MKKLLLRDRLTHPRTFHSPLRFFPAAGLVALLLPTLDLAEADAQITGKAAQEQATQPSAEKPERTFQVIKRTEIVVGDHTITYQLVAPPQTLAPSAPAPAARALSPQEIEAQQRREAKPQKLLFFSATVLDHRVTELRWMEDGKSCRAFSNLDFQYFLGLNEIKTGDAIYPLMMAFDTAAADALAERTHEVPQLALLPKDRAAWFLMEGSAEEGVSVVTAWDSIHRHFDAHREEMIRGYQEREAAKAEAERQLRENPPARKNRVISFWKKESAPRQSAQGNPP